MSLLVLLCAAVVCTGAALVSPRPKNIRVKQLAGAYWVVSAAVFIYAAVDNGGVGDGMLLHFDSLGKHAAAGAAIAALVLFGWAVFCLFRGFGRDLENDDPRDR